MDKLQEETVEPLKHEEKMQAIITALKNVGYAVLDYKTDLEKNTSGFIPSGIIDVKIIASRMIL
jgi:hypothetical protein